MKGVLKVGCRLVQMVVGFLCFGLYAEESSKDESIESKIMQGDLDKKIESKISAVRKDAGQKQDSLRISH